jgi:chromate reductase, NAD(P)H dehydrogenase (quinone)
MPPTKNILAIIGSASQHSANHKLVEHFAKLVADSFTITIFDSLKTLPHFDPDLSTDDPPATIIAIRNSIEQADGLLICTPEYVFSIPSGLKNVIEWCVSTTVFSDKPTALITASANGQKGHEELQLILKTVQAHFTPETTLLIQGIKGKINDQGDLTDSQTNGDLLLLIEAFKKLVNQSPNNQKQ